MGLFAVFLEEATSEICQFYVFFDASKFIYFEQIAKKFHNGGQWNIVSTEKKTIGKQVGMVWRSLEE